MSINGEVNVTNNTQTISLSITDAYYTEANEDGFKDDVIIQFNINFERRSRSQFDIYFDLTLPSGRVVTYGYLVNTRSTQLIGTMTFYNDATESGDYSINIEIILYSGGVASGEISHIFDPPGETSGGDPLGSLIFE